MIYIYKADSNWIFQEKGFKNVLKELPKEMQERAFRYRFEQDARNFVLGRLLLKKGLEELGRSNQLAHITYQKNGKPLLEDVFFNISHSENLVVCALSTKGTVGIDVEKEKPVNLDNFKPWFTVKEWTNINKAPSPIRQFFWFWTRKESIIKALGVNLSYLHQIELDTTQAFFIDNGKKWYLKELNFGAAFFGALCSEINDSITLRDLHFDLYNGPI